MTTISQNIDLYNQLSKELKHEKKSDLDKISKGRYDINNIEYKTVLIHNIPFIFTCDEVDHIVCKNNHSIIIENDLIKDIVPSHTIKTDNFDIIYDAGKKGGIVVTPGFINTHAHPPMYLMRTAMVLDEGEGIDETIAAMPKWERQMTFEDQTVSTIGDLTEQQKNGVTSTVSHYATFFPIEYATKITNHNTINAISVASNTHPENNPELIEILAKNQNTYKSRLAISLHYLYKSTPEILSKIKGLMEQYNLIFTFHMAESEMVVEKCKEKYGMNEVDTLEKFGILNKDLIASHCIYLNKKDIEKLSKNNVGISHLPTSNTIHKSGVFPFWGFEESGFKNISLGTDGVVSKSRLDILSEAYQTRITHLYKKTIKFSLLFKMMTVNGARVAHMKDRGKLLPGMKADIAFWKLKDRGFIPYDKNKPISLIGNLITHGGRSVRDLMINGKFIIQRRKHKLVNESKLLEKTQIAHMGIRERVSNL